MNSRAGLVLSVGLLGLLCFALPGTLRADTLLTYTGNTFNSCSGTYGSPACAGTYALSVTLDLNLTPAQLDNLTLGAVAGGDLTAFVLSFSVTDGTGLSITPSNASVFNFDIGTNASGNVLSWVIDAGTPVPNTGFLYTMLSCSPGPAGCDNVCTATPTGCVPFVGTFDVTNTATLVSGSETSQGIGEVDNNPGNWTVPEPGSASLILLGIGAVLVSRKRRVAALFPLS